jgi:hypothetical protein
MKITSGCCNSEVHYQNNVVFCKRCISICRTHISYKTEIRSIIVFLLFLSIFIPHFGIKTLAYNKAIMEEKPKEKITLENTVELTATPYSPEVSQCDATPFVTSCGAKIDTSLLNSGKLKWVALSQDLLKINGGQFNYHDTIYVKCKKHPAIEGYWIVKDCMNKKINLPVQDRSRLDR